MFDEIVHFIKDIYRQNNGSIPLHAPTFTGRDKEYLSACIDSGFVSSVGVADSGWLEDRLVNIPSKVSL